MIGAVWVSGADLVVQDNGETVAQGRIVQTDGAWFLELSETLPALNSVYADLLVRVMIRRAYEYGAHTQYVYVTSATEKFYIRLGFERESSIPATKPKEGVFIKMKHTGDIHGHC